MVLRSIVQSHSHRKSSTLKQPRHVICAQLQVYKPHKFLLFVHLPPPSLSPTSLSSPSSACSLPHAMTVPSVIVLHNPSAFIFAFSLIYILPHCNVILVSLYICPSLLLYVLYQLAHPQLALFHHESARVCAETQCAGEGRGGCVNVYKSLREFYLL